MNMNRLFHCGNMSDSFTAMQERDARLVWHPFTASSATPVLPVVSARDATLTLADGRGIIDGISSWWVINHGHGCPEIVDAVSRQLSQLEQVIFAGFTHEPSLQVAEGMDELLGKSRYWFFFSDNGSTAVEVALKIALQHHFLHGRPKSRFIALEDAYHGDTFGAMAASARSVFTRPFDGLLAQATHLPRPTADNAESWLRQAEQELEADDLAAFIFEPGVQGAGGMRFFDLELLRPFVQHCRERGVLLIADEVMTGFGRTGELFPSLILEPDLLCFSKGLTGGFLPMGLTAVRRDLRTSFEGDRSRAFFHGHSFTGSPLACAAAGASLRLFRQGQWRTEVQRIEARHSEFARELALLPHVHDVRVKGTILAFDLASQQAGGYLNPTGPRVYDWCVRHGVLLRPLGNSVYVLPPFCTTDDELSQIYATLVSGLNDDWK